MTIFEKIASGQIAADIVHEAEDFIAFRDINPQAPVHILIIPRKCIARIALAEEEHASMLGKMLLASREIAEKAGVLETGYRLVINNGRDAGESVPHLHIHLLGGRNLLWPPG